MPVRNGVSRTACLDPTYPPLYHRLIGTAGDDSRPTLRAPGMASMTRKHGRSRKPKIPHPDFADLNISSLEQHRRQGNLLIPPLARLKDMTFISWRDAGLNEILWGCIDPW